MKFSVKCTGFGTALDCNVEHGCATAVRAQHRVRGTKLKYEVTQSRAVRDLGRESLQRRTGCYSWVISNSQFHFYRDTDGRADGAI